MLSSYFVNCICLDQLSVFLTVWLLHFKDKMWIFCWNYMSLLLSTVECSFFFITKYVGQVVYVCSADANGRTISLMHAETSQSIWRKQNYDFLWQSDTFQGNGNFLDERLYWLDNSYNGLISSHTWLTFICIDIIIIHFTNKLDQKHVNHPTISQ